MLTRGVVRRLPALTSLSQTQCIASVGRVPPSWDLKLQEDVAEFQVSGLAPLSRSWQLSPGFASDALAGTASGTAAEPATGAALKNPSANITYDEHVHETLAPGDPSKEAFTYLVLTGQEKQRERRQQRYQEAGWYAMVPEDRTGAFWLNDNCAQPPSTQSHGLRHMSMSASWERRRGERWDRGEVTETTRPTGRRVEETEAGDLDFYMKSRYDPESIDGSDDEFEQDETSAESDHDAVHDSIHDYVHDSVHVEAVKANHLEELKPNDNGKFENILGMLADPRVLEAAHERLNVRRRNWTLASDELEVSHVSRENRPVRSHDLDWTWFKHAAEQLRTGTYIFKPVKRIEVSKRGRGEPRHVTLVSPKDQVIQEAVRDILERIYEPIFSVNAHGFRPGTGVHSALKSIKSGWKGVSWFLQFDVRKADDTLVQDRLLRMLAECIQDRRFLDTLQQMFEVGTIRVDTFADEEMPQGSVLSALLGNIYFHQLDVEINRIIEEVKEESRRGGDPSAQGTKESQHEKQRGLR